MGGPAAAGSAGGGGVPRRHHGRRRGRRPRAFRAICRGREQPVHAAAAGVRRHPPGRGRAPRRRDGDHTEDHDGHPARERRNRSGRRRCGDGARGLLRRRAARSGRTAGTCDRHDRGHPRTEVGAWTASPTWAAPRAGARQARPTADEPAFAEPWEGRAFALALLSMRVSGQQPRRLPARARAPRPRRLPRRRLLRPLAQRRRADAHRQRDPRARRGRRPRPQPARRARRGAAGPRAAQARLRCRPRPGSLRAGRRSAGLRRRRPGPRQGRAPAGHTRLPRYVRGHTGIVERVQPGRLLPDTHAALPGREPAARLLGAVRLPRAVGRRRRTLHPHHRAVRELPGDAA